MPPVRMRVDSGAFDLSMQRPDHPLLCQGDSATMVARDRPGSVPMGGVG